MGLELESREQAITRRLSTVSNLPLPHSFTSRSNPTFVDIEEHLRSLLLREPGIFLERYSSLLTADEAQAFEQFRRADPLVDHYLTRLHSPATAPSPAVVRNRRYAKLVELSAASDYFAIDAIQDREPYLASQFLGRQRDVEGHPAPSSADSVPALGSSMRQLADRLMAVHDRDLRRDLAAQQRESSAAWSVTAPEAGGPLEIALERSRGGGAWDESDTEGERDDGVEGEAAMRSEAFGAFALPTTQQTAPPAQQPASLTTTREAALVKVVQQRFVAGLDEQMDYVAIDGDSHLDDAFGRERLVDAQEAYFDDA